MPYVRLPGGIVAHVKMAKPRRHRCAGTEGGGVPCARPATHQCDYQVAHGKTCDAWICGAHAQNVGPDLDHCPTHAGQQAGLFTSIVTPPGTP